MSPLVIVLLAGLWGWILLPGILRVRRESSPASTVDSFERSMGVLAPVRPLAHPYPDRRRAGPIRTAHRRPRVVRRRRTIVATLGGAVASTGMTALMLGGLAWSFFALAVLALACYVALLAQLTARRTEAAVKLHRLPQRRRVQDLQAQLLVPQAVGETGSVRLRRWEH